jgi:integrase
MWLRECCTLELDQIKLARRTITLERTKNGDKLQVPLPTTVIPILPTRIADNSVAIDARDGRLFPFLRHGATCRLFERTPLSDTLVAKITGHRDPRMLKRYASLRGSELASQ